jgi:hypothetical protein
VILRGRSKQFGATGTIQPGSDVRLVEQYRHAVVNRSGERVGIRDDDGARHHGCAGVRGLPSVPQAAISAFASSSVSAMPLFGGGAPSKYPPAEPGAFKI